MFEFKNFIIRQNGKCDQRVIVAKKFNSIAFLIKANYIFRAFQFIIRE
jgi:hypothetical protein